MKVVRVICGPIMTSLDMNGISLTILNLPEDKSAEILSYIDMPVDTPFWPKAVSLEGKPNNLIELKHPDDIENVSTIATDDELTKNFRARVRSVLERIISNEQSLTEMDAKVGDGDLGIGAARASKLVLAILDKLDLQNNLAASMMKMSDVWSDGFGGSSGPLWGSFLSKAAANLTANLAMMTTDTWIAA